MERTPEPQRTQDTHSVTLLGPPKVTVLLGTGSAPLDNADRWERVMAKRLRNYLQAGKAAGPGSDLPRTLWSGGPWQVSSCGVKVVASILKDGGHREHGQHQELVRAPCPQHPGSAHHPHGSHVPPLWPSSPSQAGRQRRSVGPPQHLLPTTTTRPR